MSISGTGLTGLLAFQRALATTSHNIANAKTEGYSRQKVDLAPNMAERVGNTYVGTGVLVTGIRRIQSDIVDNQLRDNLSRSAEAQVSAAFSERVDRLLADKATGVMPTMERFFSATQDVASDPTAIPARMVMLNEAETLAGRFRAVNDQLEEQRSLANKQIRSTTDEINQFAGSLAKLNEQIVGRSTQGSPANDLLDQRDQILNKLSEKIEVSRTVQDDGAVNVFVGTGQALVMGNNANQLVLSNFSGDPMNLDIGVRMSSSGQVSNISRFVNGGEIGGLLDTRNNLLNSTQNQLGLIGLTLASTYNDQNRLGLDLNGELGQDIFKLPKVVVNTGVGNTATGSPPSVTIDDVTQLTPSDYRLSSNGTDFKLTRLPSNQSVNLVPDATDPNILVGDGLRINIASIDSPASGDNWLIQPTRFAASRLEVTMTDPVKLAATSGALVGATNKGDAHPTGLRLSADPALITPNTYLPAAVVANATGDEFNLIRPSYDTNAGGATVEAFRVLDPKKADLLASPITPVTFDAAKQQFVVGEERFALDPSGSTTIKTNGWELKVKGTPSNGTAFNINVEPFPVKAPPATTTITGPGWELDMRGTPAANDTFTVELSKNRPGDNRNMLAMNSLQDARLVKGEATYQSSYSTMLTDVATDTRRAQITRDSTTVMLQSAQDQRESLSGVNLDEEAANLMRYRQAYEASAQVISVANSLFDILLNAIR